MSTPSALHQHLVMWITRKMVADGFMVCGVDGSIGDGGLWSGLPRPPVVEGVRADVMGRRADGAVAFGEAKTPDDVMSAHTLKQFSRVGRATRDGLSCPLYVAVPRSAAPQLDVALARVGLLGMRHVVRLHVPDVLLRDSDER